MIRLRRSIFGDGDTRDSIRDLRTEAMKIATDIHLHRDLIAGIDDIIQDAAKIYRFLVEGTEET